MLVALFAVLSYLYGSIPFGYIATDVLKGEKLTEKGTGNVGVTNAFKVGGTVAGIITIAGEISKAVVPVYTGRALFPDSLFSTLLFVFSALVGTSCSVFLNGRGGKGSTAALWSVLLLSPLSCLWLLVTAAILSLLARITIRIKKLQLLCIPCVIYVVERDMVFTLFGILTSLLFVFNSYRRKDDFVYYNIFRQQSGLRG
jgi:acyl phosphate:glycerol-3-phosphate acyltransferase